MMNHESPTMVGGHASVDHRRSAANRAWRGMLSATGLLLALLSLASAVATANPEYEVVQSPYPILDSDFLASNRKQTFWLDDYRVLFVGSHKKKPLTMDDPRIGRLGIYIWDTRTNTVNMYREKVHGHLCYEDGWIHYTDSLARPYRFAAGPMGKEQLTTLTTKEEERQFFEKYFFSETTCRYHERSHFAPGKKRGWHIIPLGDSGNYFTVAINTSGPGEARFYGPEDVVGKKMPFEFNDILASSVKYYRFNQSYLVKPLLADQVKRNDWEAADCAPGWWVRSNGETTRFCFPRGPWYTPASILFSPLRDGLAIVSHKVKDSRPTAGGLYFAKDGNHMKLIDGWVHGLSTSPSGCKVAFTHAPDLEAQAYDPGRGKTSLKIIDFCS